MEETTQDNFYIISNHIVMSHDVQDKLGSKLYAFLCVLSLFFRNTVCCENYDFVLGILGIINVLHVHVNECKETSFRPYARPKNVKL